MPLAGADSGGYHAAFRLRVIDVFRGPAPPDGVLDIVGLKSGLPLTVCADSEAILLSGDVVVFAFDALGPDGDTKINTLAYLNRAGKSLLTDVEDISGEELSSLRPTESSAPWPGVGVAVFAGALALIAVGVFTSRRASSKRSR
jgi:hypothetical protein